MQRWLARASFLLPVVGIVAAALGWGGKPSVPVAVVLVVLHVAVVLSSVGHAEAIAHRVGEPLGTLVLAVAVTAIEASLIVTLMIAEGPAAATLARDTVFAAVMLVCNGVVGLSILLDARRDHLVRFSAQGANALLGTVITIATLTLVMPSFTQSSEGPTFTGSQLAFAGVSSAVMYGVFVVVQTSRHRWMFLSPDALEQEAGEAYAHVVSHEPRPGRSEGLPVRVAMLLVSLAGVVGLAKVLSPRIEDAVVWAGAPPSFVGVVIAVLVLLPESISALRSASRGEMQTSLNLSLGSALASIGLTIPVIAVASIWLEGPITLGIGGTQTVLLALTAALGVLTFGSGRATILQGAQHLTVCGAFLFLAVVP